MGIGIFLVLWAIPASASYLKDIRIGEYDGFTRIVFELDAPVSNQNINPQDSGQLVVTLNQTQPRLIRKIPVERSKHVRSIQFWQRGDRLSTHFQLDYTHFRFEYFPLSNPPRLALDLYPLITQTKSPNTAETEREELQITAIRKSGRPTPKQDDWKEPGPMTAAAMDAAKDSVAVAQIKNNTALRSEDITPAAKAPGSLKPEFTAQTKTQTPSIKYAGNTEPESVPVPQPHGLQFYLVIVLVAITIIFLVLLLIMLLSRRRWTDEKNEMNVNEFLKNQDQRITSLNAQINEQLRRYEEV